MTFLRVVFIVLLVINALLVLANLADFSHAPGGEPDRLANQLHPEKMRLLPTTANGKATKGEAVTPPATKLEASAPEPAAPPAEPEPAAPEAEAAPAQPPEPTPTQQANVPLACVSWSGLTRAQADPIKVRAKNVRFAVRERISGSGTWWVHIPPQPTRDAAEKKGQELQSLGIKDFFVIKDPGPTENAISLGLYKNEQSAKRMLEQIKAQGVQSARIAVREAANSTIRIEVSGAADTLAGFASETTASLPITVTRANCSPER